ncbi:hypothetical protein FHS31_001204 [Sphingomonas vulcanisoli]|uniref:Uncharacterized protein n=1 Tax=Sphingomonas vulcanisoli TaxID=1658060 RepID=A0ABX0TRA1_9SPHN|nr:hypothetical protein [Sphingomonas vulcanisoli]NIJ07608.1 hypothetical protein [Sphingomonas vulcanisoli]
MIDRLDHLNGDPDLELNGDELDGNNEEDVFGLKVPKSGVWVHPGCPFADPDIGQDDNGEAVNEDGEAEVAWLMPDYGQSQDSEPFNAGEAAKHYHHTRGWQWDMSPHSWKDCRGY